MKNKLKLVKFLGFTATASAIVPMLAFAQVKDVCVGAGTITFIICKIAFFINAAIPILIALGVVYFIWGVINYAIAKDEEGKIAGRQGMIDGIIALLVIVCLWGLVALLKNTFGIAGTGAINVPCISAPGITC